MNTWIEKLNVYRGELGLSPVDATGDVVAAEVKHAHYHKDVSKLASIDVYRTLDLFGVTHPCAQHAAKKVLCAGARGVKDIDKDIQEAIDTLVRWQDMRKEDAQ